MMEILLAKLTPSRKHYNTIYQSAWVVFLALSFDFPYGFIISHLSAWYDFTSFLQNVSSKHFISSEQKLPNSGFVCTAATELT